jgi:hypothetical protein
MEGNAMKTQRTEGPTPNGGDYAIAYYQNEEGELVDKSKASRVTIAEFKGDEPFHWTYATI